MRTRQETEDLIHDVLCKILPKMAKSRIRPGYQTDDIAGDSVLDESGEYVIKPFTPQDNFIYFLVKFENNDLLPDISQSEDAISNRYITINISCYGEESNAYACVIYALFRSDYIIQYLNSYGLYLNTVSTISELRELVNEEWFDRHNLNITLNEELRLNIYDKPGIIKELEIFPQILKEVEVNIND